MLLTFLSRLMSTVLTSLLFAAVVGLVANQTVLNTTYIESKLESQNAYSRLSDALSTKISKDSGDPAMSQEAVASQLKTVLTADVLKAKIDTTLKQLEAYLQGKGPVPTLDVSDLVREAKQAGLDIQEDKFNEPVTLTAATKLKKVNDTAKFVSIGTVVAIVLLVLGILAIAVKRRNYKPFANAVFSLGIMLTLTGGLMLFMPRLFSRFYKVDASTGSLSSLARDLAVVAMHDFGLRLLIIGVVTLLLGILAKYLLRGTGHKHPRASKTVELEPVDTAPVTTPLAGVDTPKPADTPNPIPTGSPIPQGGQAPGAPPRPRTSRKIQL